MDKEVLLFLELIPINGIIIDVGGCWGWHWRNLHKIRPDVKVFIIDFVRNNLIHAKNVLKDSVNENIFLIHGDATDLIFDNDVFDGYWSVQVLQHIPNYELAIKEAYRVLKNGGVFANYSFNRQWIIRIIYLLFCKKYHVSGYIPGIYFMARASNIQLKIVKKIFGTDCKQRYTEILFSPEIKVRFPGKLSSVSGYIDSSLSNSFDWFSGLARQQSYHTKKCDRNDR
jgi:ubiquinone/menaquinone biosynthesis C-methylase UbiE